VSSEFTRLHKPSCGGRGRHSTEERAAAARETSDRALGGERLDGGRRTSGRPKKIPALPEAPYRRPCRDFGQIPKRSRGGKHLDRPLGPYAASGTKHRQAVQREPDAHAAQGLGGPGEERDSGAVALFIAFPERMGKMSKRRRQHPAVRWVFLRKAVLAVLFWMEPGMAQESNLPRGAEKPQRGAWFQRLRGKSEAWPGISTAHPESRASQQGSPSPAASNGATSPDARNFACRLLGRIDGPKRFWCVFRRANVGFPMPNAIPRASPQRLSAYRNELESISEIPTWNSRGREDGARGWPPDPVFAPPPPPLAYLTSPVVQFLGSTSVYLDTPAAPRDDSRFGGPEAGAASCSPMAGKEAPRRWPLPSTAFPV